MPTLTFQNLRKNFVSYIASFGIPSTIAAFWAGHSPAVAEKNYMRYAIGALNGDNIEQAMGIDKILAEAIKGFQGKGKYKNLKLTKWA